MKLITDSAGYGKIPSLQQIGKNIADFVEKGEYTMPGVHGGH